MFTTTLHKHNIFRIDSREISGRITCMLLFTDWIVSTETNQNRSTASNVSNMPYSLEYYCEMVHGTWHMDMSMSHTLTCSFQFWNRISLAALPMNVLKTLNIEQEREKQSTVLVNQSHWIWLNIELMTSRRRTASVRVLVQTKTKSNKHTHTHIKYREHIKSVCLMWPFQ